MKWLLLLLGAINRRAKIVETDPAANAYYAAADARLDHITQHRNLAGRGYRFVCNEPGCDL